MSRVLSFAAGVLIGGLVGAVATVALAPELDEETRRRLREEALQLRGRAEEASAVARSHAEVLVDRGRTLLDEQRVRFDEALAAGKEAASEKQRELLAKFKQAQDEGEAQL
jgi:gas vesicle protein